MAAINKPAQPLIAPTDLEDVEAIAGAAAEAAAADAIASDTTHAPLVNDLVPAANLPSYVDDVLEFSTLDSFPAEGEAGKIYVALDTNNTYRWADTTYVQVGGSEIDLTPYALKTEVAAKADAADLESLAGVVAVKADAATVVSLADTVATKADASAVAAKADSATVAALAEEVAAKANAAAIQEALAEMEDEIAAKAGSAAIEGLQQQLNNKQDKPYNILADWAPKDHWDGSLQMLLEQQDTELVKAVMNAGTYCDPETGLPSSYRPIHFIDKFGNKYVVNPTGENDADFYIEWNYGHNIADGHENDSGVAPIQKWHVVLDTDAETGETQVVCTRLSETRYATVDEIGGSGSASVTPEAVAEAMSEMEATDNDIDAIFGIEPSPSEHGGE